MKKCPKCGEIFDDTWQVCLHCSVALSDNLSIKETNPKTQETLNMNPKIKKIIAREGLIIIVFLTAFFFIYSAVINSVLLKGAGMLITTKENSILLMSGSNIPPYPSIYKMSPSEIVRKYKATDVTQLVKKERSVKRWGKIIFLIGYPFILFIRIVIKSLKNRRLCLNMNFKIEESDFLWLEHSFPKWLILFVVYIGLVITWSIFAYSSGGINIPQMIVFYSIPLYTLVYFIIWAIKTLKSRP